MLLLLGLWCAATGQASSAGQAQLTSHIMDLRTRTEGAGKTLGAIEKFLEGKQIEDEQAVNKTQRELQKSTLPPYLFFQTAPYANVLVVETHDVNCKQRNDAPPVVYTPAPSGVDTGSCPVNYPQQAGYPSDGTFKAVSAYRACGIAPARFVFTTSNLPDYNNQTISAQQMVRITCAMSNFIESDSCANVLDATGNFPQISGCRFVAGEVRIILATRMQPGTTYELTIKLINPAVVATASQNSFMLTTEYYQTRVIEGSMAPSDLTYTVPNAKNEDVWGQRNCKYDFSARGYITGFFLSGITDPLNTGSVTMTGRVSQVFQYQFTFTTFGRMKSGYYIDVIAYPTNKWKFSLDDPSYSLGLGMTGLQINMKSFSGALASEANGFRIRIGTTPIVDSTYSSFTINLLGPKMPVNAYWTATSYRLDPNNLPAEPFTVICDTGVAVLGTARGAIVDYEVAAINAQQWVTLAFTPGNNVLPSDTGVSGAFVIVPPPSFTVVQSAAPRGAGPGLNQLPCTAWVAAEQAAGRWLCTFQDTVPFRDTQYYIQLNVINPPTSGAPQSWRIELWQQVTGAGSTASIVSSSRFVSGMPIAGTMETAVAQRTQQLGAVNQVRIDFFPSQDLGNEAGTQLQVTAPPGFFIPKFCGGFNPIELPAAKCRGSDSNTFTLTFRDPGAILGGHHYIFDVEVTNAVNNLLQSQNVWTLNTLKVDGIAKDTGIFQGFYMYPSVFTSFSVLPASRAAGSQLIVLRFTSPSRIPFDDFIRIRAPYGVNWDTANLMFDTSSASTGATTFSSSFPNISSNFPNELVTQVRVSLEANFEYGIRARVIVPQTTPVPNSWWVEQYRQTGLAPPNDWNYISSSGSDGFETQALVNSQLVPFDIVEEAWQNPTMIVFQTTASVEPMTVASVSGIQVIQPEIFLVAPPGFTYICPLDNTVYPPPFTTPVPANVSCVVNHVNQALRNQLHLYFPDGILAQTRYVFTVRLVNAAEIDKTNNDFLLRTQVNGQVVESTSIPGFQLAARMDNTRYISYPKLESRQVEATANQVTFAIGTTFAVTQYVNTVLEIRAPRGFIFDPICTSKVGEATYIGGNTIPLPTITFCSNLQMVSMDLTYMARVNLTGTWGLGTFGFYAIVQNPMFTPKSNYWGFTIRAPDLSPLMSEAWVLGFLIQVITNPVLTAYNPSTGIHGEAAVNLVYLSFQPTTTLPGNASSPHNIVVTAPAGFFFPNVCRNFEPNTKNPAATPLPELTACQGRGGSALWLTLPIMQPLFNGTTYEFSFLVINPTTTFADGDMPSRWWRVETRTASEQRMVDLNRVIPSFPVYERLVYFAATTLSQTGLNSTTVRFHFSTTEPLPPQQTVRIIPPPGTVFGGVNGGTCNDEDPNIVATRFPPPSVVGVNGIPEWLVCRVASPTEVILTNTEPILGGRSLITGPVYEFFVKNVTNAQSTPDLNIFRIIASTTTPLGEEVWTTNGWTIFPVLTFTAVTSSNPGYGLYTNFTIQLQTITAVPSGGSIRIIAPPDYYFGPLIETNETMFNPLVAPPPYQGAGTQRPFPGVRTICHVLRPDGWICPFEFDSCKVAADLTSKSSLGVFLPSDQVLRMNQAIADCNAKKNACKSGALSSLITCSSIDSNLTLVLLPTVSLAPNRVLRVLVQGYNARSPPASDKDNLWSMLTLNNDPEQTILDKNNAVTGLSLLGIIQVPSIIPSDENVGSITDFVQVTVILAAACAPPALLRITFPTQFINANVGNSQIRTIQLGETFPRIVETSMIQNVVELTALEETMKANIPLTVTLALSNPPISPQRADNIWAFQAYSGSTGQQVLLNVNNNVTGFRVFGQFSSVRVTQTVLSPNSVTKFLVWFVLKSASPPTIPGQSLSQLRLWLPRTLVPQDCSKGFLLTMKSNTVQLKYPFPPPSEINYFDLPSGTACAPGTPAFDASSGLYYLLLNVDLLLDYGLDYAFEFSGINPSTSPSEADNVWRMETLQNRVILHLKTDIPGIPLAEIKYVTVTPSDTTRSLPRDKLQFDIMSEQPIPGGSKISITGPDGFVFTSDFFLPDVGLASTTTCFVDTAGSPNSAKITLDTADPKSPNTMMRMYIYATNPMFTPQRNYWSFSIIDPLNNTFDIRNSVPSFDITGQINAIVKPVFPFLGQTNKLQIVFVQSTILNQADFGNEMLLVAPNGYIFPRNCTSFDLMVTNPFVGGASSYAAASAFPPPGITCTGSDNSSVVIRLPDGAGLLINNYTLEVDVMNPLFPQGGSNLWTFLTRVNSTVRSTLVDANRTIQGFDLSVLSAVRTVESGASRFSVGAVWLVLALSVLQSRRGQGD